MRTRSTAASRQVRLTGRGWTLAAVGIACLAAGVWADYPGVVALGLGSTTAVLAAVLGLVLSTRLRVERLVPQRPVPRLTPLSVTLRIGNPSTQVSREFRAQEHLGGVPQDIDTMTVGPGQTTDVEFDIETTVPGVILLGPFVLRQSGLAGLAVLRWSDGTREEVTILARTLPVGLPSTGAMPLEMVQQDRLEGGGTELRSLRQYIPGDDLRRVNAFVSARYGTLMIRQDAEPAIMSLCVLVDNRADLDPLVYAEMLDVATSIIAAAVGSDTPISWSGRSMPRAEIADAAGLDSTKIALARLQRSDDPLPRSSVGDFTVVVAGPDADPAELAQSVAGHGDSRLLVTITIDKDATAAGSAGPMINLVAPRAEEALRRFSQLPASLGASG